MLIKMAESTMLLRLCALAMAAHAAASANVPGPPNVLFVLVDDVSIGLLNNTTLAVLSSALLLLSVGPAPSRKCVTRSNTLRASLPSAFTARVRRSELQPRHALVGDCEYNI